MPQLLIIILKKVILVLVFQENAINNNKIQLILIKISRVVQIQQQIPIKQQILAQSKIINNSNINNSIKNIMMKDFLKVKNC